MAKIENAKVKGRTNKPASTPVQTAPPTLNVSPPGKVAHPTVVLFGPPKTGKSTGALSGPGKKLMILTEPDGDLPFVGRDDIDVARPQSGRELFDTVQALHAGAIEPYDRLVFDSVTFAFEVMGRQQIAKAVADNVDIRKPYGQVGAALNQIIHDVVALPVDKVFITQLRTGFSDDEDDGGAEEGNYPFTLAVTPMVYKILAPAASALGRTYKQMFVDVDGNKKVRYLVSFEDFGKSPAGSRADIETVEDLDMEKLMSQLKGDSK